MPRMTPKAASTKPAARRKRGLAEPRCGNSQLEQEGRRRMSEANKEIIRRFVAEAFVQGKVEVVDEVYSEEYFDHSLHHAQLWGIGPDREGFKQLIRMVIGGLSDLEAEVDLMVAEDEFVAARVLAKGIH